MIKNSIICTKSQTGTTVTLGSPLLANEMFDGGMEIKTKSNWFKMSKPIQKWKPYKFSGRKWSQTLQQRLLVAAMMKEKIVRRNNEVFSSS